MQRIISYGRSFRDMVVAFAVPLAIFFIIACVAYNYVNPPPPRHIVISTSAGEGDYQTYAKMYKDILRDDGIELEIRPSNGSSDNLKKLKDSKSPVQVGFIEDGIGSTDEETDLLSLGSLYFEPIWIFYRNKTDLTKPSQLIGKKIAIGSEDEGTHTITLQLFKANGLDHGNAQLISIGSADAVEALHHDKIDAAVFIATADDPIIAKLLKDSSVKLMNVDQAEAISRQLPYLHHLVLPHGAIDLEHNVPAQDVNLVGSTATLLIKDTLHPALIYPLLKAAQQVHSSPGLFERQDEFPINKDFQFPLAAEALSFYKSGTPFWQRYLPFWLATLLDRFLLVIIPMMALIIPTVKMIPKIYVWRIRTRIYKCYGELKYLETQIQPDGNPHTYEKYLEQLDAIEDRVNSMKVPLNFSDHIYALRQNIEFVRSRLQRVFAKKSSTSGL